MKNNKSLIRFFAITIIVTWILWLPSVLNYYDINVPVVFLVISMMASFTPSIVGLIYLKKERSKTEFKQQLKSRLTVKVPVKWYLIIMMMFPLSAGISYLLMTRVTVFEKAELLSNPIMIMPVFFQILFIGGALGEEFGWRGYALPKLLKIMSPLRASLIIGVIWSVWHLPLFFMEGTVQSNLPIWQFMIQNTLIAFFYTWIFINTHGNLWLMILLHAVANTSSAVFTYWQNDIGRYIGLLTLLILFAVITIFDKRRSMLEPSRE